MLYVPVPHFPVALDQSCANGVRESLRDNKKSIVSSTEIPARASPAIQLMEQIEDGALLAEKSSQKNNTLNVCCAEIDWRDRNHGPV